MMTEHSVDHSFIDDYGTSFPDADFISLTARYRLILERRLKRLVSDDQDALRLLIAPVTGKILRLCPQALVSGLHCIDIGDFLCLGANGPEPE
jgi:hypothetical protein